MSRYRGINPAGSKLLKYFFGSREQGGTNPIAITLPGFYVTNKILYDRL